MRRRLCLLFAAILFFMLSGCRHIETETVYNFYYLRVEYTCGSQDSVISTEARKFPEKHEVSDLLKLYLNGPLDKTYKNPFPKNTSIIDFEHQADTVSIKLSDQIGALTGVSLSLTCACLAKTAMDLTGAETVHISADTLLLNGKNFITFDADTILLLDGSSTTDPVTE